MPWPRDSASARTALNREPRPGRRDVMLHQAHFRKGGAPGSFVGNSGHVNVSGSAPASHE